MVSQLRGLPFSPPKCVCVRSSNPPSYSYPSHNHHSLLLISPPSPFSFLFSCRPSYQYCIVLPANHSPPFLFTERERGGGKKKRILARPFIKELRTQCGRYPAPTSTEWTKNPRQMKNSPSHARLLIPPPLISTLCSSVAGITFPFERGRCPRASLSLSPLTPISTEAYTRPRCEHSFMRLYYGRSRGKRWNVCLCYTAYMRTHTYEGYELRCACCVCSTKRSATRILAIRSFFALKPSAKLASIHRRLLTTSICLPMISSLSLSRMCVLRRFPMLHWIPLSHTHTHDETTTTTAAFCSF